MKMRYEVDLRGVRTREDMHGALKRDLHLPGYYGMNMDALWDCLMEMETPCEICLLGMAEMGEMLSESLRWTLKEAAEELALHGREMKITEEN